MDKEKGTGCVTSAIARSHSADFHVLCHLKCVVYWQKFKTRNEIWCLTEKATTLQHIPEI